MGGNYLEAGRGVIAVKIAVRPREHGQSIEIVGPLVLNSSNGTNVVSHSDQWSECLEHEYVILYYVPAYRTYNPSRLFLVSAERGKRHREYSPSHPRRARMVITVSWSFHRTCKPAHHPFSAAVLRSQDRELREL